jgi:hypothetical protein
MVWDRILIICYTELYCCDPVWHMVLYNYLEANAKVPWEDLRYLFGEIMYGGHITDDWDRRLCKTYLEVYMHPDMVSLLINNNVVCHTGSQQYNSV